MNIEEIRKNAPEGATHYMIEDGEEIYLTKDYMGRWCWIENDLEAWPCHSRDCDDIELNAKPL